MLNTAFEHNIMLQNHIHNYIIIMFYRDSFTQDKQ